VVQVLIVVSVLLGEIVEVVLGNEFSLRSDHLFDPVKEFGLVLLDELVLVNLVESHERVDIVLVSPFFGGLFIEISGPHFIFVSRVSGLAPKLALLNPIRVFSLRNIVEQGLLLF